MWFLSQFVITSEITRCIRVLREEKTCFFWNTTCIILMTSQSNRKITSKRCGKNFSCATEFFQLAKPTQAENFSKNNNFFLMFQKWNYDMYLYIQQDHWWQTYLTFSKVPDFFPKIQHIFSIRVSTGLSCSIWHVNRKKLKIKVMKKLKKFKERKK